MATGPKVATSPLDLLNNDSHVTEPFLSQIFNPVIGGTIGFCAVVVGNWASKRPIFSGIQKYILAIAGGTYAGKFWDDRRRRYLADRDAMYRHYIQLHPDDFPPYERKQYKDILEKWIPIR